LELLVLLVANLRERLLGELVAADAIDVLDALRESSLLLNEI